MSTFGRYEIIEQLGQGSMGTVYRARDPIMGRDVAIKRILLQTGQGAASAELRERFFREARAAGRLAHPGIVTVFDVSEHEGMPFLVMEYIAGRTLQSILQSGERLDLSRACDMGIQLAEALNYAHQNSVIHRDIKPANILITNDGRIKITDFGIAKLIESQLTASGQLLGTPAYMPPEAFMGVPIDGRADLFSLGVVIYCMATGEKPFAGDTLIGVQYRVVHTDPLPPRKLNPAISPDLEAAILRCIEKDPARRYQSGEELAHDLRSAVAGQPISKTKAADRTTPAHDRTMVLPPRIEEPAQRRRVTVTLVVLIPFLVTFLAFTTFSLMRDSKEEPPLLAASLPPPPEAMAATVPSDAAPPVASEVAPPPQPSAETPKSTLTAVIETPKRTPPRPIVKVVSAPPAPPAGLNETQSAAVQVLPLQPQPSLPVRPADVLPAAPQPAPPSPNESHKSARLLIASSAMPEPLSIVVNMDNEPLFSRTATVPPPFGFEDLAGRIRLQSVASAALSEEVALPPGRHKIQVNVLLAARRVAKVQEVTERFYVGQRRVLQIEFLPESEGSGGRDSTLFKIKLR